MADSFDILCPPNTGMTRKTINAFKLFQVVN